MWDETELLRHERDVSAAHRGKLRAGSSRKRPAGDDCVALARPLEPSQDVEQRRLSTSGTPDERREDTRPEHQADVAEDNALAPRHRVRLRHRPKLGDGGRTGCNRLRKRLLLLRGYGVASGSAEHD